jgi:hypothetical protein
MKTRFNIKTLDCFLGNDNGFETFKKQKQNQNLKVYFAFLFVCLLNISLCAADGLVFLLAIFILMLTVYRIKL